MSDPAPEASAAAAPPSGPGALLRQARERAGLAVEDLAAQLKLSRSALEALEQDDFSTLSEAVYVRGYYRKVAKVLPVSEAELLEAYSALSRPKAAPLPPRIPLAGGVAAGTSRRSAGRGMLFLGLFAAALVLLFILVDQPPPRRLAPEPAAQGTAPVAAQTAPPEPAAPAGAQPDGGAPSAEAAPGAAPAAVAAPGGQLVLSFGESSFVRVEDSQGKTLAIGLVRGGEQQALAGTPPYTVFLGNARSVTVTYGGQPFDFSPHVNVQNDTARFTVP